MGTCVYRLDNQFGVSNISTWYLQMCWLWYERLYGVTLAQTISFFMEFPGDTKALKAMVRSQLYLTGLTWQNVYRTGDRALVCVFVLLHLRVWLIPLMIYSLADTLHTVFLCGAFWHITVVGELSKTAVAGMHLEHIPGRSLGPVIIQHNTL